MLANDDEGGFHEFNDSAEAPRLLTLISVLSQKIIPPWGLTDEVNICPLAPDGEGGRFTRLLARHPSIISLGCGRTIASRAAVSLWTTAGNSSFDVHGLSSSAYLLCTYVHTYIHYFIVATELRQA